jgi:hypothetical protein
MLPTPAPNTPPMPVPSPTRVLFSAHPDIPIITTAAIDTIRTRFMDPPDLDELF